MRGQLKDAEVDSVSKDCHMQDHGDHAKEFGWTKGEVFKQGTNWTSLGY